MSNLYFQDKVAIITGSSGGIGKATAIKLCEQGACIVLNGRNETKLQTSVNEFIALGYKVIGVSADITSEQDCKLIMNAAIEAFGKIDILINNGSITMNDALDNVNPIMFKDVFLSNSLGTILPTMAALPHIKKTKGSIVFISSLAGLHGMPSASAYCAGKMSLTSIWQSYKIEMSSTGIHFGICYVGFTQNDSDKRMLTSNGELVTVPKRPPFIIQSQNKVASKIVSLIKYRKSKVVFSVFGKMIAILLRLFPRLVLALMIQSQKNKKK